MKHNKPTTPTVTKDSFPVATVYDEAEARQDEKDHRKLFISLMDSLIANRKTFDIRDLHSIAPTIPYPLLKRWFLPECRVREKLNRIHQIPSLDFQELFQSDCL